MADQETLGQATHIWSMLDDMAENNPAAYRKFIDKQMKEGKELNRPPAPHMCVQTCVASNWIPVYINVCSWSRITKPKDDSAPIPVFGSKFTEKSTEEDGEHFVVHVAFHPEVLEQFGRQCTNKEEQDALIKLAIAYIEDQHKTKLSSHYYLQNFEFKGDASSIHEDFGLTKDPMKEEFEKLAKSFAPVADIATKDPELLNRMTGGDNIGVTKEEAVPDIKIPGMTSGKEPKGTRLIEEVKITPTYSLSHRNSPAENSVRSIIIRIELEKVESVQQCTLDITESSLRLSALDYYLTLDLPEKVIEEEVKARFSKTKHQLTVTLPAAT